MIYEFTKPNHLDQVIFQGFEVSNTSSVPSQIWKYLYAFLSMRAKVVLKARYQFEYYHLIF